jgi:hypothetical protein
MKVKGIKQGVFNKIKDLITVKSDTNQLGLEESVKD